VSSTAGIYEFCFAGESLNMKKNRPDRAKNPAGFFVPVLNFTYTLLYFGFTSLC
jgi:hypothetical protein